MRTKRAWSRGEKALFLVPLSVIALGFGFLRWERAAPVAINVGGVKEFAFSPDGRHFLTRSSNKNGTSLLSLFDPNTGICQHSLQLPGTGNSGGYFAWAPDSLLVAIIYDTGKKQVAGSIKYYANGTTGPDTLFGVVLWDVNSGLEKKRFPLSPSDEIASPGLSWKRNGELWNDAPPALFDVRSGKRLRRFVPPDRVQPVARVLPTAGWNTTDVLLNANHSLLASRRTLDKVEVISIFQLPDNRLLQKITVPATAKMEWASGEDILNLTWNEKIPGAKEKWKWMHLRLDAHTGRRVPLPLPPGITQESVMAQNQALLVLTYTPPFPDDENLPDPSQRALLWDSRNSKVLWQIGEQRPPDASYLNWSFSPDGRLVSAFDLRLQAFHASRQVVWDVATGTEIWRSPIIENDSLMQWAPDSHSLAIFDQLGGHIYRLPDRK